MTEFDKDRETRPSNQAHRNRPDYDTASQKSHAQHGEDQFEGSSGILFEQAMAQTRMAVCLCDPGEPDLPIVFANRAFRELTGYSEEEVVGHNCRFLQGPETDPEPVAKMREAIAKEEVAVVELLNYRKDGSTFWNALHLGPIYDQSGNLVYFFGSQWDVSDVRAARAEELYAREMARELSHRMKNMFSVISGIVNITGRLRGVETAAREINERVQALGRAYETTLDEASSGNIEIGQAIRAILNPYALGPWKLEFRGDQLKVPFGVISGVGLALHELAANATKYGAWSKDDGKVVVDWKARDSDDGREFVLDWNESGGPGVAEPPARNGSGNEIMDRMVKYGGGRIDRDWLPEGLQVQVTFPLARKNV